MSKNAAVNPASEDAAQPWWRAVLREPIALGLTVPIIVRPWLDGVTYPTDNFYFVWAVILLFTLWGVQVLFRGLSVRFLLPTGILAGFWVVAGLTAFDTTQLDTTYRALILWAGYFFLFVLTVNAVRTPAAIGIVLTAFVFTSFAETVWSLIHFKYMLPMVRESVLKEPLLLKTYFGTLIPGPELVHRLNVNRAFGSLLFPNALAAFLILGIPFAIAESARSVGILINLFRAWRVEPKQFRRPSTFWVSAATLGTWFAVVCVAIFIFPLITTSTHPLPEGMERLGPLVSSGASGYRLAGFGYVLLWTIFVAVIPILVAIAVGHTLRRYGLDFLAAAVRVWIFPPLAILQVAALWLTYSRGGLLALVAAIVLTAVLLALRSRKAVSALATTAILLAGFASTLAPSAVATPPKPPESAPGVEETVPADAQKPPASGGATSETGALKAPSAPSAIDVVGESSSEKDQETLAKKITKEGVNLTMTDLLNPASFELRLTYWRTGLRMALANFWTGVGLGNFGTVYPKYQYVGAGDVKTAHNDYLQALCETGIAGFVFYCAFWAYFVVWGALRLRREEDWQARWGLAGLYGGVLALLIHSLVDFNFFNPSLAFFAFLLAGVFYSWGSDRCEGETINPVSPKHRLHQLIVLPMVIAAALVAGMALRVFISDRILGGGQLLNVGNRMEMNAAFDAGEFLLSATTPTKASGNDKNKYPAKDIVTITALISNPDVLRRFGSIRVATGTASGQMQHRALRPDELIPRNAFFVLTDSAQARKEVKPYIEIYLEKLAIADDIFPHNPELAAYFAQWYDLLAARTPDEETRSQYTVQFLQWAQKAVRRSPECFVFREWLAKALWSRGNADTSDTRQKYFEQGLDEYRMAAELCPSAPRGWRQYGDAMIKYGNALVTMGSNETTTGSALQGNAMVAEGQDLIVKGRQMLERAEKLESQQGAS